MVQKSSLRECKRGLAHLEMVVVAVVDLIWAIAQIRFFSTEILKIDYQKFFGSRFFFFESPKKYHIRIFAAKFIASGFFSI